MIPEIVIVGEVTLKSFASSVFFSSSFFKASNSALTSPFPFPFPFEAAVVSGFESSAAFSDEASVDIKRPRDRVGVHCRMDGRTIENDGFAAAANVLDENWRDCWRRARRNISGRL